MARLVLAYIAIVATNAPGIAMVLAQVVATVAMIAEVAVRALETAVYG